MKTPSDSAAVSYFPLDKQVRLRALIILVVGLLALLIPVAHLGESPKYTLTAADALAKADAFIISPALQMDPSRYAIFGDEKFRHVTYPESHLLDHDSITVKYMLQQMPVSSVAAMLDRYKPIQHWTTRYFTPLNPEDVTIYVQPETGKVIGFNHYVPEDRPGGTLTEDAAVTLAANFAQAQGVDTSAMDLKEHQVEKEKARTDQTMVWEARAGDVRNLPEAHYRVSVEITGDRVSEWKTFWELSDSVVWTRWRQLFLPFAINLVQRVSMAAFVLWALVMLIRNIRRGLVRWRPAMIMGGVASVLILLSAVLGRSQMLRNYINIIPIEKFKMILMGVYGAGLIFGTILMAAVAALVISSFPGSVAAWRASSRRVLGRDAAAALLAAGGFAIIVNRLEGFLLLQFHGLMLFPGGGLGVIVDRFEVFLLRHLYGQGLTLFSLESTDPLVSAVPALGVLAQSFRAVLFSAAAIAAIVLLVRKLNRWMIPVALVALASMVPTEVRFTSEFGLYYVIALLNVGFAAFWCWRFARNNYLAYGLVFWILALQGSISNLLGTAIPAMQIQGWLLVAVAAVGVIWALAPAFMGRDQASGQAA